MRIVWLFISRWSGVFAAVVALLLKGWTSAHPEGTERLYSRGIFVYLRKCAEALSLPLDVPGILWALIILLCYTVWNVYNIRRRTATLSSRSYVYYSRLAANAVGWLLFFFYFLWAYNYDRIPYTLQTGLEIIEPDRDELVAEYDRVLTALHVWKSKQKEDLYDLDAIEEEMSRCVAQHLKEKGYPADYQVTVSRWRWKGLLLRFSTAGIYIPHALQGNIDGGLHLLQQPAVAMHEMTHAFGLTHEGIANLVAYQAAQYSEHPWVRYSAELSYFRYLSSDLYRMDPELYVQKMEELRPAVRRDLEAIRKQLKKYPDIMPQVRDRIYDSYLKSHGISDGLKSYSQMVRLVMSERAAAK